MKTMTMMQLQVFRFRTREFTRSVQGNNCNNPDCVCFWTADGYCALTLERLALAIAPLPCQGECAKKNWATCKVVLNKTKPISFFELAGQRWSRSAIQHVRSNQMDEITTYAKDNGKFESALEAALDYAVWSAATEYRLLASYGAGGRICSNKSRSPS